MTATNLPASLARLTLPKKHLTCAETAKLIRTALKQAFPEIKFSVRSSTYSGGASISVGWVDGPKADQVEAIAKTFQGAAFDGMQDLKTYNTATIDGQVVHFGADFVFCNRTISPAAMDRMCAILADLDETARETLICRLGLSYTRPADDLRSFARDVAHKVPCPAFEGRRSALAASITDITLN